MDDRVEYFPDAALARTHNRWLLMQMGLSEMQV